jgi:hypothetical protein
MSHEVYTPFFLRNQQIQAGMHIDTTPRLLSGVEDMGLAGVGFRPFRRIFGASIFVFLSADSGWLCYDFEYFE